MCYKFGDFHVTFKSWTFHKCEAEREGKVVKFGFNLTIEVRQNVIFLPTGKNRSVSCARRLYFAVRDSGLNS